MRFQELREYYEASDDEYNQRQIDDTRKAKLTLRHLNKLRKKRAMDSKEKAIRDEDLSAIYSKPQE
jgi:hypothetical protein